MTPSAFYQLRDTAGRMPEDQSRVRENLLLYAEALQSAVTTLEEEIAAQTHQNGGRPCNEPVHAFVAALAQIYRATTGKRPTYVVDPATGKPGGRFGRFVEDAMHTFPPFLSARSPGAACARPYRTSPGSNVKRRPRRRVRLGPRALCRKNPRFLL
jgi:hypothetical protein